MAAAAGPQSRGGGRAAGGPSVFSAIISSWGPFQLHNFPARTRTGDERFWGGQAEKLPREPGQVPSLRRALGFTTCNWEKATLASWIGAAGTWRRQPEAAEADEDWDGAACTSTLAGGGPRARLSPGTAGWCRVSRDIEAWSGLFGLYTYWPGLWIESAGLRRPAVPGGLTLVVPGVLTQGHPHLTGSCLGLFPRDAASTCSRWPPPHCSLQASNVRA